MYAVFFMGGARFSGRLGPGFVAACLFAIARRRFAATQQ
jgi:hypothetical protein